MRHSTRMALARYRSFLLFMSFIRLRHCGVAASRV